MAASVTSLDGPGRQHRVMLRVWGVPTLIFLAAGLYSVFFNYLPEAPRLAIAAAVGLFLIASACLPTLQGRQLHLDLRNVAMSVSLLSLLAAYLFLIDTAVGAGDYVSDIVRSLTSVGAIVYFATTRTPILPVVKIMVFVAAAGTAIILTATHGLYDYAGVWRPQPFGGLDAIHSSAYVITSAFLGTVLMRMQGEISRPTAWLLGLPLFLLIVAYQVRTTWVMLIVFFGVLALLALKRAVDRPVFSAIVGVLIAAVVVVVPVLLLLLLPGLDLETFSSGRTETYIERFVLLSQREPAVLLFGSGLGSDSFFSSAWWWEPKDSHNDFLHVVIEQGLINLVALAIIIAATLRHATPIQAAVVLSLVSGSLISNALLDRPMLAVLHLGLMAVASVPRHGRLARVQR
jgi:hypothetical protein